MERGSEATAMSITLEQLHGDAAPGGVSGGNPKSVPVHQGTTASAHEATPADPAQAQASPAHASPAHRVTRIVATSPWYETGLTELARAYELLLVFTWRQIGVQYKQAVLGIGWALISPLVSTAVFTLIFGNLAGIPSEGLPYPLFVLSGMITWQYFARAITSGSNSILASSHIITKVYFPRMILPLSAVLAGLVDYAVNLVVLLLLMVFYGHAPGPQLMLLPVFLLLATMIGFALSLWLSALNALYRDIGFMIPLALQTWMFLTPVIYPTALVPGGWSWLMQLNPMTAVVQGARWAVLPAATPPDLLGLAMLAGEIIVLFLGGVVTFHKIDAILADRI
jgi:lipopolysaccharide transport system permease protein